MVRNFLFHRINPDRDPLWDPMDPELFDKCLKIISQNYEVVTIEDIPHAKLHEQTATISFDDGYKDNIEVALPILSLIKSDEYKSKKKELKTFPLEF